MAPAEALEIAVKYSGVAAVVITIVVGLIGLFHYLSMRRSEERGRQYDRYHKLLEDLNATPTGNAPFIDRQIAVVYEMRNFPDYWPVSLRILERYYPSWKKSALESVVDNLDGRRPIYTLVDEAELTIKFIKRRQSEIYYLGIPEEDRL